MVRIILIVALLVLGPGCAGLTYQGPRVDPAQTAAATEKGVEHAAALALARRQRVYDLAWPVLAENVALCPQTRPTIGIVLADRESSGALLGGLRAEDMEALGRPKAPHIFHAYAGSPAALAGVLPLDVILEVSGKPVTSPSDAGQSIRKTLEDSPEVTLKLARGEGEPIELTITAVEACDMAVKIAYSDALNATAATGDIVIFQGLIRALDDAALQYVIAHEAAHVALRHPRKYVRNTIVSGMIVGGPILYTGAWVGDKALGVLGAKPDQSLRSRALRASVPWAAGFESEADYLGAYMFARAGGDLEQAGAVYEVFGQEAPRSLFVKSTHPVVPERAVRLEAIRAEIEALRDADQPLVPRTAP